MAKINSLSELLKNQYEIETSIILNRTADKVGTAATKIATNNPKRVGLSIFNLSSIDMYVSPKNDVSTVKGIYLPPNGGNVVFIWRDDFELVANEFHAIALAADADVLVVEVVIV